MPMRHLDIWTSGPGKYAPLAVSLALVALIVALGWNSLNIWRAADQRQTVPALAILSHPVSTATSTEKIADAHLFGIAESQGNAGAAAPPPSSWHVIGVVAGDSPEDSMADIVIDGNENIWHVGDRLPDGSTLTSVDDTGIKTSKGSLIPFELRAISYDDHFDTLPLDSGSDSGGPANAVAAAPLAHPEKAEPVSNRMTELRAAGVAVWLQRIQNTPHPNPGKPN